MPTTLLTRPAPGPGGDTPDPRRPHDPTSGVTRLATRTIRASGWRGVLVVALIALSVAIATAAAVAMRSSQVAPATRTTWDIGAADVAAESWEADGRDRLEALSPELRAYVEQQLTTLPDEVVRGVLGESDPDAATLEQRVAEATGTDLVADATRFSTSTDWLRGRVMRWFSGDPHHPLHAGRFTVDGPTPGPGEALASPALLARHGAAVGDVLDLPGIGELAVVGTVTADQWVDDPMVFLAPDTRLPNGHGHVTWLFSSDRPGELVQALCCDARGRQVVDAHVTTRDGWAERHARPWMNTTQRVLEAPSFLGSALGAVLLAQVGFVAAAAFATGSRRRIRELGMLGAAGASPRQLQALVRREGLVLGTAGAVVGALLGVVGIALGLGLLQRVVGHAVDGLVLHPLDVLGPAALGAVAAVVAAWVPARTVASVPTTTALAGRVPVRSVPSWVAPLALVTTGVGVLALLYVGARDARDSLDTLVFALGAITIVVGMATFGVPAIGALGRVADRLPALLRMAVRDSARQRTRSAAAVAALSVVLVAPVLIAIGQASEEGRWPQPPSDVLAFQAEEFRGVVQLPLDQGHVDHVLGDLDVVATAEVASPGYVAGRTSLGWSPDGTGWSEGRQEWLTVGAIAPEALTAWGLDHLADDLAAGRAIVVRHHQAEGMRAADVDELLVLREPGADASSFEEPGPTGEVLAAIAPRVPHWSWGGPDVVVSHEVGARLGIDVDRTTMQVVRLAEPLTPEASEALEERQEAALLDGARLWTSYAVPTTQDVPFELLLLGGALLLALLVQGLVTALAATESDRDLGLMVAVGAAPASRRRFHALQAMVHGLVAGAIALGGGVLLWHAGNAGDAHWRGATVLPWGTLALVVVGVPVLAGLLLGAVMRSAPPRAPRRIA